MKKTTQLFACLLLTALSLNTAQADYTLNLMRGVTQISNDVYELHMLILWICVAVGALVFGVMFFSIFFHRKSKGHVAATFHENTTVEIVWTVIPTIILVAMAIPATDLMRKMDDVKGHELSIKVTGWQWKWEYEYIDKCVHFFSSLDPASEKARQVGSGIDPRSVPNYLLSVDKPLVVPIKTKIRFLITAGDVNHAFWVPDFGWKKDAIPGFINEAWVSVDKPGTYRGQCAELCGKDHGFMPIVVIAKEQADYDAWLKKAQTEPDVDLSDQKRDDLVAKGAAVYEKNCATCHMPNGEGVPGAFPALTKSPVVVGDINAQSNLILNGKGAMPAFGKMLNAVELAQVITFTRNGLGNAVGDQIQPKAIQDLLPEGVSSGASACEANAPKQEKVDTRVKLSLDELVVKGEPVYAANCAGCHQEDGAGLEGMFPAIKGSALVKGDINKQIELINAGKGAMPPFGAKLNPIDFAAVVTYTRNALGNKMGDLVQPAEIESLLAAKTKKH
ncbi:MAG: cytochrome c oxidase subunit II [Methylococcaceae bacterium]|nr:cytochrome c oxidase subunit II [Methylococcaceae bacterium]